MGNENSQLIKDAEPLNSPDVRAAGPAGCLPAAAARDDPRGCGARSPLLADRGSAGSAPVAAAAAEGVDALPKLPEDFRECFERFARQRDGRLGLDELRSLAAAACSIWQVPAPDAAALARAFERHRGPGLAAAPGLSFEGFAACANELLVGMLAAQPDLAIPSLADILAAQRQAADRLLLHTALPTRSLSLRDMGAAAVGVVLAEVAGLPGGAGCLSSDELLHCRVAVRRRGRLLPRRAVRVTAVAPRSSAGCRGEPTWRFDQELSFDDPALLWRRGELHASVRVKHRSGPLHCALAVAKLIPIPTPGEVEVPLIDPATGRAQGKVRLSAGFPCSNGLAEFLSAQLRLSVQRRRWSEARAALQLLRADAVEYVAGRPDGQGRTLLMAAARHPEGTPLVRDLLAISTSAWLAADGAGANAVHHAALSGSLESLAALLGSGLPADTPAAGLEGATPLMLAALRCSADHVRLLLGCGARAERVDERGLPAAAWALGGASLRCPALSAWAAEPADDDGEEQVPLAAVTPTCESPSLPAAAASAGAAGAPAAPWRFQGGGGSLEELLPLLIGEVWRAAPPVAPETGLGTPALGRIWLPMADMAADGGSSVAASPASADGGGGGVLRRFSDELCAHCDSPRLHRALLDALFAEALAQRRERL